MESLSASDLVLGVCLFVSELNILKSSDGHSYFLRVVSFLILFASVFSLIGVRVALASSLNLVFGPLLIFIVQEDLLNFADFDLNLFRNDG